MEYGLIIAYSNFSFEKTTFFLIIRSQHQASIYQIKNQIRSAVRHDGLRQTNCQIITFPAKLPNHYYHVMVIYSVKNNCCLIVDNCVYFILFYLQRFIIIGDTIFLTWTIFYFNPKKTIHWWSIYPKQIEYRSRLFQLILVEAELSGFFLYNVCFGT